jgi:hypothetical protein
MIGLLVPDDMANLSLITQKLSEHLKEINAGNFQQTKRNPQKKI